MEICPSCKSDVDPEALGCVLDTSFMFHFFILILDRYAAPDLGVAGAIVRRMNPSKWPQGGLPASYRSYSTLYELLLVKTVIQNEEGDVERVLTSLDPAAHTVFRNSGHSPWHPQSTVQTQASLPPRPGQMLRYSQCKCCSQRSGKASHVCGHCSAG